MLSKAVHLDHRFAVGGLAPPALLCLLVRPSTLTLPSLP